MKTTNKQEKMGLSPNFNHTNNHPRQSEKPRVSNSKFLDQAKLLRHEKVYNLKLFLFYMKKILKELEFFQMTGRKSELTYKLAFESSENDSLVSIFYNIIQFF